MPDFPIIDSHVHLYDVERLSYGWLSERPQDQPHAISSPDFDAARGTVQVDKIVFAEVAVDPGLHIDEAAFVQELADADAAPARHGRPCAGGEGRRGRGRSRRAAAASARCAASAG